MLAIVETGFPKKGTKSAGVARQRNPTTGRVENCQVGLFLAYVSPRGWAVIDRALYLPEEWTENEVRRWNAWHRHITLSLLAHASLQITRARAKGDGDHLHPT